MTQETWKPLDYSKYEYPDELPKGYYWGHVQEWTCPNHDFDVNEEGDCPNACCRTCELCYTATYRWTGEWQINGDNSVLAQIIKHFYLPTIKEQLAAELIFLKAMLEEDLNRSKYGEGS